MTKEKISKNEIDALLAERVAIDGEKYPDLIKQAKTQEEAELYMQIYDYLLSRRPQELDDDV